MSKKKKTIIIAIPLLLIVLVGLCILSAVGYYQRITDTGLNNTVSYGFGKKARVIILAGQSNAAGCSRDDYLQQNVSQEKYKEYENGYDNVYINYFVSESNISYGFEKCAAHQGEGYDNNFFGPELGLAEKLNELYPDETFFIIKWAYGGTTLCDEWRSPSARRDSGGDLYGSFVQFVKTSLEYLRLRNYDVNIEAVCWMQGESDSVEERMTLEYEKNLTAFISDIRSEFSSYASDDGIAFIDAYIAATIFWKYYNEINAAKQAVADSSPLNVVIDTISHGLTVTEEPADTPDIAHYDSLSEIKLGHLFAENLAPFIG